MRWAWRHGGASLVAVLTLLGATAATTSGHGVPRADVIVDANRFDPFSTALTEGGTVQWDVREGGHTIVADDGRFDFRGEGGGPLPAGATPSFTVGDEAEVVRYHCTIHGGPGGQGMAGVLVVGDPVPEVPDPAVIRVPEEADLTGAVAAARPGTRIEVAPGRHVLDRTLRIHLRDDDELPHGLDVVGTGPDPSAVVVDVVQPPQQGAPAAVVEVTGWFVRLANLTVDAGHVASDGAGIHLDGARQVELDGVVVDGGGFARDGIGVTGASGATIRDVRVHGTRRTGIRVEPCAACGVLLDGVTVRHTGVGVLVEEARGVAVRRSLVEGNAAGVVVRGGHTRASTVTIRDSELRTNVRRTGLPPVTDADRRLVVGAGIWLDGVTSSEVTGNVVADNRFGVVLSGGALDVRVADNAVEGNETDLAWDGIGARTCFRGNTGVATTQPPTLAALHPCGRTTVGVPWPVVTASLLTAAYS